MPRFRYVPKTEWRGSDQSVKMNENQFYRAFRRMGKESQFPSLQSGKIALVKLFIFLFFSYFFPQDMKKWDQLHYMLDRNYELRGTQIPKRELQITTDMNVKAMSIFYFFL